MPGTEKGSIVSRNHQVSAVDHSEIVRMLGIKAKARSNRGVPDTAVVEILSLMRRLSQNARNAEGRTVRR